MAKIEVKNIFKIFGSRPKKWLPRVQDGLDKEDLLSLSGHILALRNISLSIEEGIIYVIMGLSGSGKSTLIRHFNRLLEPSSGKIFINDLDITNQNISTLEKFRQKTVSMVFQKFALFPHHTILENVAYGLKIQGICKSERENRARYWLNQVNLSSFENQFPNQLSGGMQQRVGLARALASDTEILLMDEAFSALDPLMRREMQDHLLNLQVKLNKTIIFITHDLDEALRLGNRIAILKHGELIQEGTPEDILLTPVNNYVQAFLQDVNSTRVLNAAHAVNQPRLTLTMRSRPKHALDRMHVFKYDYAPVLDGKRLAGVLTAKGAECAINKRSRDISHFVEELASVPSTAGLGKVITYLIHSDQPFAVTGDGNEFIGMLSRKKVLELANPILGEF